MNVNLETRYLGLELRNPLVISACPLTGKLDTLRRLEEAVEQDQALGARLGQPERHVG